MAITLQLSLGETAKILGSLITQIERTEGQFHRNEIPHAIQHLQPHVHSRTVSPFRSSRIGFRRRSDPAVEAPVYRRSNSNPRRSRSLSGRGTR